MINKAPIQVGNTVDPISGLKMFRKVDKCLLEIDNDYILVRYWEWLESPNGTKVNECYKSYIVKDEPEISHLNEIEEKIVDKPANTEYTKWAEYVITSAVVGASLGNDVIIGAINRTLKEMPFNVPDDYVTQP